MKNIIASDFYFFRRNKKTYIYITVVCLIYLIVSMTCNNIDVGAMKGRLSLIEIFKIIIGQYSMMLIVAIMIITCFYIGKLYSNRYLIYQINCYMNKKTVCSKYVFFTLMNLIAANIILVCSTVIAACISDAAFALDLEILQIYLLFMLLIVRFSIRIVSLTILLKNGLASGAVNWMIIVFELFAYSFGKEYEISKLTEFSKLLLMGQLPRLIDGIKCSSVILILLTTAIECGLEIFITLRKKELV